jgi:hypothetical protein
LKKGGNMQTVSGFISSALENYSPEMFDINLKTAVE